MVNIFNQTACKQVGGLRIQLKIYVKYILLIFLIFLFNHTQLLNIQF